MSGYPSDLYDELLPDWGTLEFQVMNQKGVRTGKLWFNFVPDRVHGCRYAGKNFTDRQRIKRKAQRWGRRYQALPRPKRLAVLSSIQEIERTILAVHSLLAAKGRFVFSVPARRDDVMTHELDSKGRRFTALSSDGWKNLCLKCNLEILRTLISEDGLGRGRVLWINCLVKKQFDIFYHQA